MQPEMSLQRWAASLPVLRITSLRIAFDIKLMRPGCALIQAALGADPQIAQHFPVESWLLAPTDAMRVYEITFEQLDILVYRVRESA